jgi:hypothetical protein
MDILRYLFTNEAKSEKKNLFSSRFTELNKSITDRLENIRQLLKQYYSEKEGTGNRNKSNKGKSINKLHTQILQQIRLVETEWNRVHVLYKDEVKNNNMSRNKSKDLAIYGRCIERLKSNIDNAKNEFHLLTNNTNNTKKQVGKMIPTRKMSPNGMFIFFLFLFWVLFLSIVV